MGLDTSHDCWHGAYSGFSFFREALARAAGYAVWLVADSMEPYALKRTTVMLDWGHLGTEAHLEGEWEETPADPLLVLIVHRDESGIIRPAQAGPLADRIEELAPKVTGPDAEWVLDKAAQFVAGLRLAASKGEDVGFH